MNLILTRKECKEDGIFSELCNIHGETVAWTLEHSYPTPDGITPKEFKAKLPPGEYLCVRGEHRLHPDAEPFNTFEVTGIENHTGILFHVGNFNRDSDGCVLVGKVWEKEKNGKPDWVSGSKTAFANFMELHDADNSFWLTVKLEK